MHTHVDGGDCCGAQDDAEGRIWEAASVWCSGLVMRRHHFDVVLVEKVVTFSERLEFGILVSRQKSPRDDSMAEKRTNEYVALKARCSKEIFSVRVTVFASSVSQTNDVT